MHTYLLKGATTAAIQTGRNNKQVILKNCALHN